MIESHIYIILTCDDCGKAVDVEEYDELSLDAAMQKAIEQLGWEIVEGIHICPECQTVNKVDHDTKHV